MPGLVAKIEEVALSGTFVDSACRYTPTSGTPLVSAVANNDGGAIAGVYNLTFSSVVAGVSALVSVATTSPNNPNKTVAILHPAISVSLDGTTIYKNVIRGVDLVFSSGLTGTDSAQVRVGHFFGNVPGFGDSAGIPGTSRKIRVENTGDDAGQNCQAELTNIAKLWAKVGQIFARVFTFAENATPKIIEGKISPYAITVDNVTGSAEEKTMDVLFDGSTFDVINLTDLSEGTSEGLNVVDRYRVTSGSLEDLEFILSQDAEDTDTANIFIFDKRFCQIAADESGSPGTFGTSPVTLTQSGQSAGVINAGGFADFHVRYLVTAGGISTSNPYPLCVRLSGQTSGGWND